MILFLSTILEVFCFFRNARNKIYLVFLLFLALVFSSTYGIADYQSYSNEYYSLTKPDWTDTERGWMLLQFLSLKIGLSFEIFRFFIFTIAIFLSSKTIMSLSKEKYVFIALYSLYPFMLDMVQIRNFLASSMLIYAIHYLFDNRIKSRFLFCAVILLASTFHNTFIVYLPLVIIPYLSFKIIFVIAILMTISFSTIIALFPKVAMMLFSDYHGGNFAEKYVESGVVSPLMQSALAFIFLFCAVMAYFSFNLIKNNKIYHYHQAIVTKYEIVCKCIVLLSFTFVICFFTLDFVRLFRNIQILLYCLMWEASARSSHKRILRFIMILIAVYCLGLFIWYAYPEGVLKPCLNNSYIFEL